MRSFDLVRKTTETEIYIKIGLDGTGMAEIATGIGFFDHMLHQLARHGNFDLSIRAKGDLHIDDHHCVEDVGIVLGKAFSGALGDMVGISRYGSAYVPMDETLSRAVVDLSGRPAFVFRTHFATAKIGTFDTQLVHEFLRAFAMNARLALHIETLYGENDHHIAESCFKALARALRQAVALDGRAQNQLPSTKGTLSA